MSVVISSGLRIHYEEMGAGEPGLLLVHGWGGNRLMMAPLAERLSARHLVLNVDLREHGRSADVSPAYSSADVVADLAAVAAAAGVSRPVVVGHSLGAKFALAYVALHPTAVTAVVLLDTSIVESAERKAVRLAELDAGADIEGRRRRIASMFLPTDDEAVREQVMTSMLSLPRPAGRAALVAGDMIDTATALRDCPVPVLYVAGARPAESLDVMRELRPDLEYHQITGSGHFVQMFAAAQVSAVIEAFLDRRAAAW
jgi:pimeloyl-ACP methyl ester carboxylesterase